MLTLRLVCLLFSYHYPNSSPTFCTTVFCGPVQVIHPCHPHLKMLCCNTHAALLVTIVGSKTNPVWLSTFMQSTLASLSYLLPCWLPHLLAFFQIRLSISQILQIRFLSHYMMFPVNPILHHWTLSTLVQGNLSFETIILCWWVMLNNFKWKSEGLTYVKDGHVIF